MNANLIFIFILMFAGGTIVGYMQKKMNIVLLKEEIDLLKEKLNSNNEEDLRWGIPLKQMRQERDDARKEVEDIQWWITYWLQKWESLHEEAKKGKFQHTCDVCNSSERV